MVAGIFGMLNTGKEALLAHQLGINVTGHNIANVNTKGFSRQEVILEANSPVAAWPGQVGTGVRATRIERVYDRYLATQINDENQALGKWEAQKSGLESLESIFNESDGYGLNRAMNEFWNAWQDLANNPSGIAERNVVVEKGKKLAFTFNRMHEDLVHATREMDGNVASVVDRINSLSDEIAYMNKRISSSEMDGEKANDYRDKRDLLVKELSSLIDIKTFENKDGGVNVLLGGGHPLVNDNISHHLSLEARSDGLHDVVWEDGFGSTSSINISGGELKGWIEARDDKALEYIDKLNTLSHAIITGVNGQHHCGYQLNSNNHGGDFFTGTDASDMDVSSVVQNDVTLIAAAGNAGGAPGDNENALEMAALQNSLTMSGNTVTYDDFYSSLVSEVGSASNTASSNEEHQRSIMTYLENRRESFSGVSLDEEMINLVKFQHAYEAAAKVISSADELLGTLINMV